FREWETDLEIVRPFHEPGLEIEISQNVCVLEEPFVTDGSFSRQLRLERLHDPGEQSVVQLLAHVFREVRHHRRHPGFLRVREGLCRSEGVQKTMVSGGVAEGPSLVDRDVFGGSHRTETRKITLIVAAVSLELAR